MRRIRTSLVLVAVAASSIGAHKGGAMPDRDGDRIPDAHDPFPDDRERPGKAEPNTIYAHSSSTLYIVGPRRGTPTVVGDFTFSDGRARQVTDIAIDPWGVTWAVAFGTFMTCHPATARCEVLRELPGSFNALTVLPDDGAAAGPARVRLFGVTTDGRWFGWLPSGPPRQLGSHGGPSSGDAYSTGDLVRASRDGASGADELIELDPSARDSVRVLAALDAHEMYGFAACSDRVYGFDASGRVYRSNADGFEPLADVGVTWWGAACSGPQRSFVAANAGDGGGEDGPSGGTPATKRGQPQSEPDRSGCSCR